MQFLVTWRFHETDDQVESLKYFQQWQPPAGVEFKGFFGYADGSGGCAIVEAHDVAALARTTAPFTAWMRFEIRPILPIEESAAINGEAIASRATVAARG
jgi:hypothetical protein